MTPSAHSKHMTKKALQIHYKCTYRSVPLIRPFESTPPPPPLFTAKVPA